MTPDEEFTAFARAWQPRLLRAAYLVCGDPHLAQDLLQSALIKVALRWGRHVLVVGGYDERIGVHDDAVLVPAGRIADAVRS